MSRAATNGALTASGAVGKPSADIWFAVGILAIVLVLLLPLPTVIVDIGLAFSVALSLLILLVALWIDRPLEFSAFPTVLLIATLLRLALNVATTRLILQETAGGQHAAGYVIAGFANFVMAGDFIIGAIVFVILITVNFLVITKGASRIAEVGARFSLDAMPGKQMAIDADLSAGLIDERTANVRRRELEEESAFFGAMDGAAKFVRGDAVAGLIITAINSIGGVIIGVLRHGQTLEQAVDHYTRLSVGDGLVTQIPALIVSLAAGILVSKGGTRGAVNETVLGQLGYHPRALSVSGGVMIALGIAPGLPLLPFAGLGGVLIATSMALQRASDKKASAAAGAALAETSARAREPTPATLAPVEIELCFGKQVSGAFVRGNDRLAQRVMKMRRNFARQFGLMIPEIKVSDDLALAPKRYEVKMFGTVIAGGEVRLGEVMVMLGDGARPDVPGEETREPAYGMKAMWVPEPFVEELRRQGFAPIDALSVLLTHVGELVRTNLAHLLTYKNMKGLIGTLDPEYRKLVDEISPVHISHSGIQAVLKMLLAERVSIRSFNLILEAIAEIAPFTRKIETIAEHVRARLAQQICGDIMQGAVLKLVRLGTKWDMAFHQAVKRDGKGDVVEFDIDPRQLELFAADASATIRRLLDEGHQFAVVSAAGSRPYVRMVLERMYPTLPVISHAEVMRNIEVQTIGTMS